MCIAKVRCAENDFLSTWQRSIRLSKYAIFIVASLPSPASTSVQYRVSCSVTGELTAATRT